MQHNSIEEKIKKDARYISINKKEREALPLGGVRSVLRRIPLSEN